MGALTSVCEGGEFADAYEADRWRTVTRSHDVPIRGIARADNGTLLGAVPGPRKVMSVIKQPGQQEWKRHGCVVSTEENLQYGDAHLIHLPGSGTCFCAYRVKDNRPDPKFAWQVVCCRSDDMGSSWRFDSVVETSPPGGPFVGAPFLHINGADDLQVYFDNNVSAQQMGVGGYQWVSLKEKADGVNGPWGEINHVLDSSTLRSVSNGERCGLLRDGMPSVAQVDDSRILLVCEAVDPDAPHGAPHQNFVKGMISRNNGSTWSKPFVIYKGRMSQTGNCFNAYNPWVCKADAGHAFVTFLTDEDCKQVPDKPNLLPKDRSAHSKVVRALDRSFKNWSDPSRMCTDGDKQYNPGIVEEFPGKLVGCVDRLDGTRSFLEMA